MNFFIFFLDEFLSGYDKLLKNKNKLLNVKSLRIVNKIKANDRSRINFYWRYLELLKELDFIELRDNRNRGAKSYRIKSSLGIERIRQEVLIYANLKERDNTILKKKCS